MRKIYLIVLSSVLFFFAQQIIADDSDMQHASEGKACGIIANACISAGYSRDEHTNKKFWQDCMKPLLYGQSVADVTINSATINACRYAKINELKQELKDLQNVK